MRRCIEYLTERMGPLMCLLVLIIKKVVVFMNGKARLLLRAGSSGLKLIVMVHVSPWLNAACLFKNIFWNLRIMLNRMN